MHYRNSSVDFCAYIILSKHPHFAAGGQFRTQARKSGVRGSGTRGLASLPLPLRLPDPPSPTSLGRWETERSLWKRSPVAGLHARRPGSPGPTAWSGLSRAPRVTEQRTGLCAVPCCALPRSTRTQLPKAAATEAYGLDQTIHGF